MAIQWGSYQTSGGLGVRVGIEVTVSTVTSSSTSVTLTFAVYTQNTGGSYADAQTLTYGGSAGTGSTNFTNNESGSATLRATRTWTHNYNSAGDSPGTQTFSAALSGAFNGVTPSKSVSASVPSRPGNPPAAPSSVAATRNNDNSHTITWTNNSTGNAPYQYVELRRWNNVTNNWVQIAVLTHPATSYTWTNPGTDARYRYAVRATNAAGASSFAYSDYLSNTPAAPTNVAATPVTGGIRVTWTNRARWSEGVRVERREDSGGWVLAATLGPTVTQWLHSTPDPAHAHTYRVMATVTGPTLSSTPAVSNVVSIAAPPNAPTNLEPSTAFDATEDRVLTWVPNPTDGSVQQAFQIRHRLLGAGSWTTAAKVDTEVSAWTLPAGTYANGDTVEWQVATWGVHPNPSPYSATAVMAASARPTVTINDPDGSTWGTSTATVTWGYYQADDSPQSSWEVRLEDVDGVVLETRSGPGAASSAALTTVLGDAETYTVFARGRSAAGLWSPWDQVTFPVAYAKPPYPSLSAEWDIEAGAMVLAIANPDTIDPEVDAVSSLVQRRIGYDGEWVTVAADVPLNTTITDPIPHLAEVNYYRAVAFSDLPSSATSGVVEAPARPRELDGMVFVNAGPGFGQVAGVWANAQLDVTAGRARTLHQFAGRPRPVEYAGVARSRTWSVRATLLHKEQATVSEFATPGEFERVEDLAGVTCYRDVIGHRWFASMGPVASSFHSIEGTVGWSMTEVDYEEGA